MKTLAKIRVATPAREAPNALSSGNRTSNPSRSVQPSTEFGKTLQSLLGKARVADDVNEEEFFAGAVYQIIKDNFGNSVANDFKSTFKLNMADKPLKERVASAERAAKESLKFFVNSTILTKEDANGIKNTACQVAQLDSKQQYLWDSLGKTKAVTSFAKAEKLGQTRLASSGYTPAPNVGSSNTRSASADVRNLAKGAARSTLKKMG